MIESALFKRGMRRLASGVSIVTTKSHLQRHGFAATAVSSVSADPPTLLVCVNRTVSCHDVIRASGVFCVNILGESNVGIVDLFSTSADRPNRFNIGKWTEIETGAPALKGALASFDCRLLSCLAVHSHTVVIGEVVGILIEPKEVTPLIYLDGNYRQLATG